MNKKEQKELVFKLSLIKKRLYRGSFALDAVVKSCDDGISDAAELIQEELLDVAHEIRSLELKYEVD